MSFKPIDGAKEDFRKYLDRKGVMDVLTKAFVLCYDERPENPIEKLVEVVSDNAKILGASSELKSRLMNTELELKQARSEIDLLRKQLTDLGVPPVTMPSLTGNVAGNGPTIATLSAEAEKTVPSSNTSAVEANTVNTGAIPKTPKSTQATQVSSSTPENTTNVSENATQADATATTPTSSNSSNNNTTTGAKTEDTSGTNTTSAATNTEDSTMKEAAT